LFIGAKLAKNGQLIIGFYDFQAVEHFLLPIFAA
jgi:hypothetical protein